MDFTQPCPPFTGVAFRPPAFERLADADIGIFRLDGRRMATKEGLMEEVSRTLRFPDYFGRNWDALDECLGDLEWLEEQGFLVVIEHAEHLLGDEPHQLPVALSVFERAGGEWAKPVEDGELWDRPARPFHVVFQYLDDNRKALPEPVRSLPDVTPSS